MTNAPMIDHDRIATAVRVGLPDEVIAERMDCSRRTVRRVRSDRGLERNENRNPDIWGSRSEWALWCIWHDRFGASKAQIARGFCRTRQAVHRGLRRLDRLDAVGGVPNRYPHAQS